MSVKDGDSFALPNLRPVTAYLKAVPGSAMFTCRKRDYVQDGGTARVVSGEILHPLETSRIKWNPGGSEERVFELSSAVLMPMPDSFAAGLNIKVDDGFVEIIRREQFTQPIAAGMALEFGDKIKVNTGSIVVHYANGGGDTEIYANETYVLNKAANLDSPAFALELNPAFTLRKFTHLTAKAGAAQLPKIYCWPRRFAATRIRPWPTPEGRKFLSRSGRH